MLKKLTCLRRATVWIVGLLLICCIAAYIGVSASHGLFVPIDARILAEVQTVTVDRPEIAACTVTEGGLQIAPLGEGTAEISSGDQLLALITCGRNGFVADRITGRYTGEMWVRYMLLVFLAGTAVILLAALRRQTRQAFFHYATPLMIAFLLLDALTLLILAALHILPNKETIESTLAALPTTLLLLLLPIMIFFVLTMLISNISLLRHEGKTWRNLLGSLIGFALSIAALMTVFNSNASGSLEELHLHIFLINFISGLVIWTECKLAGVILCGVRAAKHQPAMDKDYVLILGCKLSRKGGLTPLLRGRVDRALVFARAQEAQTGHMPVLIPCGGKGKDELRSEASAMREYLLEKGVPETGILAEDRSVNTWENMRNAQAMMKPDAKVAYATTNYHVFRAGVWARRNGLQADGMGSRTKWYYWPNAFMREYVALVTANLPHELIMIVLIGLQSGLLAYLYQ